MPTTKRPKRGTPRRNAAATALATRQYAPKVVPHKHKTLPRKRKHKQEQSDGM
jgi:hypothetical protein